MIPVIAIGGISGGGKTSLASKIETMIQNVIVIHMDNYYQLSVPIPEYDSFYNWDCLESIDWDCLIADIVRQQEISSLIVVEGTMILNYSQLQKYFSHKFFITLPHKEALDRRRSKFSGSEPDDYFDRYVWPAYNLCNCELTNRTDVEFLDGTLAIEKNYERVLEKCFKCSDSELFTSA